MAGVLKLCRRFYSFLSPQRVLKTLEERTLIHQSTRVGTVEHSPGAAVYVGFDPTADSLHVGNLLAIVALLHFRHAGYQPIAVVGGATGAVGDPSGRQREREKLSHETLEKNLVGISETLTRIFRNDEELHDQNQKQQPPLKILNNADWWHGVEAVEFVSDIARHFRLVAMLGKESVKQRLQTEEGMSCAEFLYPVFQAYDFLHLHKHHNCWLQLGGCDQWGNITAGCDFVRRNTGNIVHGLTLPLLMTASGEKIGKSTGNAVWLSDEKTSCYELYQYFVRTTDQDVEKLLLYFTFLPTGEVEAIMREHKSSPEKFTAQKTLAENMTRLVHGECGLQQALNATAVLFGDREALLRLSGAELEQLFEDAPTAELSTQLLARDDLTVVALAVEAGAIPSLFQAQNLVKTGGLYINFLRVGSEEDRFDREQHVLAGNMTVLRVGKKNYRLIKWRPLTPNEN